MQILDYQHQRDLLAQATQQPEHQLEQPHLRALVVGAILAAMQLAGMTAVAHAQADNEGKDARRPPTQGQVGEAWHQPQVAPSEPNLAGDTRRPPTESQIGEPWRHQTNVPMRPTRPDGPHGWRIASLGFLAAALALAGG